MAILDDVLPVLCISTTFCVCIRSYTFLHSCLFSLYVHMSNLNTQTYLLNWINETPFTQPSFSFYTAQVVKTRLKVGSIFLLQGLLILFSALTVYLHVSTVVFLTIIPLSTSAAQQVKQTNRLYLFDVIFLRSNVSLKV